MDWSDGMRYDGFVGLLRGNGKKNVTLRFLNVNMLITRR